MSTTAEQTCKGHGLGTWLRRGEGMLKLVDPAVIEQVYGSLLREYHRFDASPAEWAREQSRRVGAERERHNNHSTVNIKGLY